MPVVYQPTHYCGDATAHARGQCGKARQITTTTVTLRLSAVERCLLRYTYSATERAGYVLQRALVVSRNNYSSHMSTLIHNECILDLHNYTIIGPSAVTYYPILLTYHLILMGVTHSLNLKVLNYQQVLSA